MKGFCTAATTGQTARAIAGAIVAAAAFLTMSPPAWAIDLVIWNFAARNCGPEDAGGVMAIVKRQAGMRPPSILLSRRKDGYISGVAQVSADGKVTDIRVVDQEPTDDDFTEAYKTAVMAWQFKPGTAGTICITTTVDFHDSDAPWEGAELRTPPPPTAKVAPATPPKAVETNMPGVAAIGIEISAAGSVIDSEILLDLPKGYGFGPAAEAAVRAWQFVGAEPGRYRVLVRFPKSGG